MRPRTLVVAFVACAVACVGCSSADESGSLPVNAGAPTTNDAGLPAEPAPEVGSPRSDSDDPNRGSGGSGSKGSTGSTSPTVASVGGCSDFAYCEDFEDYSGSIAANQKVGPWTGYVGAGATMTVDTVRPYSGKKALHVVMPVGGDTSAMLNGPAVDAGLVPGNNLFGRAMIYFVGTSGDGGYGMPVKTHWLIFSVSGSSTEAGGPVNINMNGAGSLNYQQRKGTGFELSTAGGNPTLNAWHCIQWQYDGSAQVPLVVANAARVWMDGELVSDVPRSKGWHLATPWTKFSFGLAHHQTSQNPVEYFMDSFAVDGQSIPCKGSAP